MIVLNEQVTMNESASGTMGAMSWLHRYIFCFDQMGPIHKWHLINISSVMLLLDLIQKLQHWLTTLADRFKIR
jgi:hypothetical protein